MASIIEIVDNIRYKHETEGEEFVKKPYPLMVAIEKNCDKDEDDEEFDEEKQAFTKEGGADKVLFSMLKDLRKQMLY